MLFSKLYLAATFLAGAFAVPLPNNENINSPTYSIIAYSIGKDAKRDSALSTDRNLARAADIALAKREEAGAEYSVLLYSIGKEERDVKEKRDEYSVLVYSIGKEGEVEEK
ncbi:uncharacterized protein F4817DRAFT_313813 [Daldinia loculata]|uniref:uncharacterized protein n=1 Tax=Daldinia loculata TaxID=103429 RepID=UPI0020C42CD4|nr:uncharacterized protein F4817DRAFT_313813 [Daldinia loculata]KAI1649262.1 hypothetical protein F4817DRAFT_313813 [Daldinia loculata]